MANFDANRFNSEKQDWETPDDFYAKVDAIFHFTRDVCATPENTKHINFWSQEDNCLAKEWDGVNWMNPPFKNMKKFIQKAYDEQSHAITVCFTPARTNTNWWHDLCMRGEVYFVKGRPKFKGNKHGLPQPLALVVFGRNEYSGQMYSFEWK